jgi:hypothetical protein
VLGVGLEVVEGPTRSINAPFIEVHNFSRRQSRILCTVHVEAYVRLRIMHTVRVLPLVNLHTLIFDPII